MRIAHASNATERGRKYALRRLRPSGQPWILLSNGESYTTRMHVTFLATTGQPLLPKAEYEKQIQYPFFFPLITDDNHTLLLPQMSFAGRRRGNKVKKGVQFTLMVVGEFSP